ncbi:MAG: YHS domain-containing (seleno)protein [Bacteroidota bacterium]
MRRFNTYIYILFAISCSSNSEEVTGAFFESEGYAIGGYDPVAYYEQSQAKRGFESETVVYEGAAYCFSSTKNKSLFELNPQKYLPAYGGWCAYAVAEKSIRMAPDPTEWQIQDGKLQLFTSNLMTKLTGSLLDEWNENPGAFKAKADENWDRMN